MYLPYVFSMALHNTCKIRYVFISLSEMTLTNNRGVSHSSFEQQYFPCILVYEQNVSKAPSVLPNGQQLTWTTFSWQHWQHCIVTYQRQDKVVLKALHFMRIDLQRLSNDCCITLHKSSILIGKDEEGCQCCQL